MTTAATTHRRYGAGALAFLMASAAWTAPAFAQGTSAADALEPEESASIEEVQDAIPDGANEIIVTARLRSERLQDVPVAITALSSETLEQYSVDDIADMASFVPSMVVGRQVTGSSASIFLRGVGSSSLSAGFDQSVSFNIDGLPMSRGREILFSQFDLQQVEVLKGPQALFFGRNTTGGLVNVISNNPRDYFELGGKAGYGIEGQEFYGETFVSGPITDTVLARLAVRVSDSEGSLINSAPLFTIDPSSGFQRRRVDDHRGGNTTISTRGTLLFQSDSPFEANLKAGYTKYKDNGAGDLYERICGGGRTVPRPVLGFPDPSADCEIDGRSPHSTTPKEVLGTYRYARDGRPYTDLETLYGVANLSYDLGGAEITSITSYYTFKQEDLNDFVGSTFTNSVSQLADFEQIAQEFRAQTTLDGPINGMVGFFYAETDFIFNTDVYILPAPVDNEGDYRTFARDNGFDGRTVSAFAELNWDITPQLELAGGARYSKDKKNSYQRSLDANDAFGANFPPGLEITDEYSEDNISPQVSLTFKPNPDLSVYAAYKQGFKAGGYNISQTLTATASAAAGQFTSEGAKGGELGLRTSLLDRSLRFNMTGYYFKYTDLQVQFYNPVTTGQVVANAGGLVTKGIEADFTYDPFGFEPLSLYGAVAYNKATYKDFIGQCYAGQTFAQGCNQFVNTAGIGNGQIFSGRTAPKAPEWGARLGALLDFPLSEGVSFGVSGDANYTSSYNYTDALRPDSIQDDFVKFNASVSLGHPDGNWKLSLIGRNLTNELVVTSANDMSFTGGTGTGGTVGLVSDLNAIIAQPREIYIEASFNF